MARITIERARALADRWKVQCEDQERQPSAAYYRNASPHDLIKMLETGKGMDGKKLVGVRLSRGALVRMLRRCAASR
jgi:hypothetical protein